MKKVPLLLQILGCHCDSGDPKIQLLSAPTPLIHERFMSDSFSGLSIISILYSFFPLFLNLHEPWVENMFDYSEDYISLQKLPSLIGATTSCVSPTSKNKRKKIKREQEKCDITRHTPCSKRWMLGVFGDEENPTKRKEIDVHIYMEDHIP